MVSLLSVLREQLLEIQDEGTWRARYEYNQCPMFSLRYTIESRVAWHSAMSVVGNRPLRTKGDAGC